MNREEQIAAGSVMIDARELAPRLGFKGRWAWRRVRSMANAGLIPAFRPNSRTMAFHLPTVMAAISTTKKGGRK